MTITATRNEINIIKSYTAAEIKEASANAPAGQNYLIFFADNLEAIRPVSSLQPRNVRWHKIAEICEMMRVDFILSEISGDDKS